MDSAWESDSKYEVGIIILQQRVHGGTIYGQSLKYGKKVVSLILYVL